MKSLTPLNSGTRHLFRPACAGGLALLLCGCSSDGSAEWDGLYQMIKAQVQRPAAVTLDNAAAIPYATLGFRVDGGPESIAVLATDDGAQKMWASGKTVTLVTIDGRIQRTVGLEHNLSWTTGLTSNSTLESWLRPHRTSWTADYNETSRYGIQITCDERPAGNETIVVLGTRISTVRIEARCASTSLNWTFTDVYWVGRLDGVLWRSIQYIHPSLGPIELETLRPPG